MKPDYEMLTFKTPAAFRAWLAKHGATTPGVWLRFYKKGSNIPSITYAEALDQALCYGWIDSIVKKYDDVSYVQKFTPRRAKSLWSKRNIEYIARLTKAGLMTPAGLAEVERAKVDGRWAAAYDKPTDMKLTTEFLMALKQHPKAAAFFETLGKSSRYTIGWHLQTAKTEATRLRRQAKIIDMLEKGQKP